MKSITYLTGRAVAGKSLTAKISSQKFALQKKLRTFALSYIFKGGDALANLSAGIFYAFTKYKVPTPVRCVNAPVASLFRVYDNGKAELFCLPALLSIYCLTF